MFSLLDSAIFILDTRDIMQFFVFLLGLCIGSFLNVLIDRLPHGMTLWGRSKCDWCKKILRWYELIPLISWVVQRARCRRCHKAISVQYPLIELGTAIGFVVLYSIYSQSLIFLLSYCLLFSSLLVIFVADLKYQIIPDSMVFTGFVGSLMSQTFVSNFQFSMFNFQLLSAIGAALFFYTLWFVTKGRGMGFGDVKLAFLLGLILGFPGIVIALYSAFLTGAIVGVILILGNIKSLKSKIAFGPFLIFGTFITLLWGEKILLLWKGII